MFGFKSESVKIWRSECMRIWKDIMNKVIMFRFKYIRMNVFKKIKKNKNNVQLILYIYIYSII